MRGMNFPLYDLAAISHNNAFSPQQDASLARHVNTIVIHPGVRI